MNESYNAIFEKYLDKVRIFDYQDIPENRDVFLISAKEFNQKKTKMD